MNDVNPILKVINCSKTYPNGCQALKNVSFEVQKGEFLVAIGLSGSGKSTLLRCISRLLEATDGAILFRGENITHAKGAHLREIRSKIAMVFQQFNLVPRRKVITNVLTGALHRTGVVSSVIGRYNAHDKKMARDYIAIVGLTGKEEERADNLSGGQQQRVAIARALMQQPDLLLADEPVASLDPATSHSVMKYLEKLNKELGVTVVCNLHFLSLARQYASRVIALKEGKVIYQGQPCDIDQQWFRTIYGEDAIEMSVN